MGYAPPQPFLFHPQPAVYPAQYQFQSQLPTPPPSPPCVRYLPTPEDRLGWVIGGRFRLDDILGSGAYGVVYTATDIHTQLTYAVKTLPNCNADGSPLDHRQIEFKNREIRSHWKVSAHPNVVSMLKIIDDYGCTYVVLEFCPEGDLFYNITDCERYVGDDARAKRAFLQLLDAVDYCHGLGVYHRDLKPENILVTDQGNTVKLADFGLATSSKISEDHGCGSTFYMSPECLDHTGQRTSYYCAPNDVWSLGVILVNLTCGRNPWKQASPEDSTYREYMRNPEFLKTILPVSDELNGILGAIFTRDPTRRITLPVLRQAILNCSHFTRLPQSVSPFSTVDTAASPAESAASSPASEDSSCDSGYYSDSSSDSDSDCDDDSNSSVVLSAKASQQGTFDGLGSDRPVELEPECSPSIIMDHGDHMPLSPLETIAMVQQQQQAAILATPPTMQAQEPLLHQLALPPQNPCAPAPTVAFQNLWCMMVKPFLQASQSSMFHYPAPLHSQVVPF